ncbi:hypothetical protein LTS18_006477 [Coniosporium uncinatum]|uniref:Uncharacterized protein n=1 Tax=Coniosporium uncinatum TaxID=93489 RepID=A0ACC3DQ61_9PEZI|nr:hypothetical protein LTS18_006477 [Coniosporium uncinatum]
MTSPDLKGRLALVTGASGGIGRATCLALADLGCSIAAHYFSNEEKARSLVQEIEKRGVKAEAFKADLGDYDEVRALHTSVTRALGAPAILFNNAGTTLSKSNLPSISDLSVSDFERTWRTNCGSAFLLTQLCLPDMETSAWGRVIFCSSVAAFTGGIVGPHYASSKSALHGLIHWLAGAYAKKGVTVNGVAPALIEGTAMLPGATAELEGKVPVGRLGRPEEVAETVVWMVRTGYVTNKVVAVDGGMFVQ